MIIAAATVPVVHVRVKKVLISIQISMISSPLQAFMVTIVVLEMTGTMTIAHQIEGET